jgi:hypothetical protein
VEPLSDWRTNPKDFGRRDSTRNDTFSIILCTAIRGEFTIALGNGDYPVSGWKSRWPGRAPCKIRRLGLRKGRAGLAVALACDFEAIVWDAEDKKQAGHLE